TGDDLTYRHFVFLIRGIDVNALEGPDGVLWRRRVSGNDLDASARVRGGAPGHPPFVSSLFAQPQEPKQLPCPLNVVGVQVGDSLDRLHRPSLTPQSCPRRNA